MKTFKNFLLDCELVESLQPLPSGNKYTGMLGAISRKFRLAKLYAHKRRVTGDEGRFGTLLKKNASQIKKLKSVMRNHDPLESRFKELENRDRGEKKSKTKLEKDYELSSDGKYHKRSRVKEQVDIYDIEEGKIPWDDKNRPLRSGWTPREKNRAKRVSTGVENPEHSPSEKHLERYGKLKTAHDEQKNVKTRKDQRHKNPEDYSVGRRNVVVKPDPRMPSENIKRGNIMRMPRNVSKDETYDDMLHKRKYGAKNDEKRDKYYEKGPKGLKEPKD
jgi:hypothetical protein